MKKSIYTLVASLLFESLSCDLISPRSNENVIGFQELPPDLVPPCLRAESIPFQFVLRASADYDSLKIAYAPQGTYESFIANGSQTKFKLSYLPLDSDHDGKLGPGDLVIYLTGQPLFVEYLGRTIRVQSNPFYTQGDSIWTFNDSTHIFDGMIPCDLVFSVDSISGEITFVSPPPTGNQLSICAVRRFYSSYQGRNCNIDYFDFSEFSIIGIQVVGNGCLQGLSKQLTKDETNKVITCQYRVQLASGPCNDDIVVKRSWFQVPKIPDDYQVVFTEAQSPRHGKIARSKTLPVYCVPLYNRSLNLTRPRAEFFVRLEVQ
jgi:hypothetical protein